MIGTIVKILKQIALISVIIGGLTVLGVGINALIPWNWLTILFALARRTVMIFDFMNDTDTLWIVLGRFFQIMILVYVYIGVKIAVKWFKN